jgi:hypothetical protein
MRPIISSLAVSLITMPMVAVPSSFAAESLFRTAARVCVREADTIDEIVKGRLALSAKIDEKRAELNGLSPKKNKRKHNKIQGVLTDLLYESNAATNKYQFAVAKFQMACSKKTMTFDVYEVACKGKLENKFCGSFKAHHKKLTEMGEYSLMPPGIN